MSGFYSWAPGSGTKYGAACLWHPRLWQAWLQGHSPPPLKARYSPHPVAEPHPQGPGPPSSQGLAPSLCLCAPPRYGSRWVKRPQDQDSLSLQGKPGREHVALGLYQGSAVQEPVGDPRQLTRPLTPGLLTHMLTGSFGHSLIC